VVKRYSAGIGITRTAAQAVAASINRKIVFALDQKNRALIINDQHSDGRLSNR